MAEELFGCYSGVVTDIRTGWDDNCSVIYRLEDKDKGPAEFLTSPDTYFSPGIIIEEGSPVLGFYDRNAPMVLSFPPRYQPLAVIYDDGNYNVKLDYFDEELVSSDGELKIHVGPGTQISGTNGQPFLGDLSKKTLLVFYGMSTRSIPAQTTPEKIVVFCK